MTYFAHLDRWVWFVTNMTLGTIRSLLLYQIMFSFCINEYVMAEGAIFMSQLLQRNFEKS